MFFNSLSFRLIALLFVCLSATAVRAQEGRLTLLEPEATVGHTIQAIQSQTSYKVAYTGSTLDTERRIAFPGRTLSVKEALDRIVEGTEAEYIIQGRYIALIPVEKKPEPAPPKPPRTDDRYAPGQGSAVFIPRPSVPGQPTVQTTPSVELPAPYSVYTDPDLYTPLRNQLPSLAVKSNLLYAAGTFTPNLGIEFGLTPKATLEITGGYNPWNWEGSYTDNKKHVHMYIQPEYRWWACERFNGHFFGVHGLFSLYNVGQTEVPMLFKKEFQYEGYAVGAGVSYGYHLMLSKRWGVEFTVGVGAAYLEYDKYSCGKCGEPISKEDKFYFGPTKLGVSLVFMIR